jgi:acyl-CoA thioesterase
MSAGRGPQALAEACAAALWAEDRASAGLGMLIARVAPGEAELAMEVQPRMVNGHGICHGGFIFALADSAFAFACNSYNRRAVAQATRSPFFARRGWPDA